MKETNILCKENFGWKHYKNDVSELWYNGVINSSFQNLAKNLCDKSQVQKKFLINLDEIFRLYTVTKKICASMDKISSIPIFYFILEIKFITRKAYLLDNFIDFNMLIKTQFSNKYVRLHVGNETLYNNLKIKLWRIFIF